MIVVFLFFSAKYFKIVRLHEYLYFSVAFILVDLDEFTNLQSDERFMVRSLMS